jgi:FdhE protein
MTSSATVRVMSPEEITARAGGETPFLHWPQRATVFAEREMRLRQLARGHAMEDYLAFLAQIAHEQHRALQTMPSVPLPDGQAVDRAARAGMPPLPAADWPRDPAWRDVAKSMAQTLATQVSGGPRAVLEQIACADEVFLERQADLLLHGLSTGLDVGAAPMISAALQVYWTHLLLATQELHQAKGQPFGRIDEEGVCPCCGSLPTASITRSAGESLGQRYLHCSLCNLQWHMVRIKCTHCLSTQSLAYQSLSVAGEVADSAAATAKIQAETCDDCGSYLKIVHTDRDPFVDPVADDVASLTLDLLVSEAGLQRHGVNFMLLFGDPGSAEPPPDPAVVERER